MPEWRRLREMENAAAAPAVKMLRKRVFIPAVLLLTISSPLLFAAPQQSPDQQPMPFTVEGKINEIKGSKITLSTGENVFFYVLINDKTQILRADGSAGKSSDLRVGIRINVKGDLDENGNVAAKKIQIEAAKSKSGENP